MTVVLSPEGRGRWNRLTIQVPIPADLFPAIRDGQVHVGDRWFMAGRHWRVVQVTAG